MKRFGINKIDRLIMRVLVISNNCLSKGNSNGRTLFNLISFLKESEIANFYIHSGSPDFKSKIHYFRVTDYDAVQAFFKRKDVGTIVSFGSYSEEKSSIIHSTRKSPLKMLVRNFIWNCRAWEGNKYTSFISSFSPDIILFQAGDAPFLNDIAIRLAKQYSVPLVVYNSEEYPFKKYNYMSSKGHYRLFFWIFHMKLLNATKRLLKSSYCCVYNSSQLRNLYVSFHYHRSAVAMTSSSLKPIHVDRIKKNVSAVYLGNLSCGRVASLLEIARALEQVSPKSILTIYGGGCSEQELKRIRNTSNVKYAGIIPYDKVISTMQNSDLIVHAESFDKYHKKDVKYSFSTKIADCLCCGVPFVFYGPDGLVCTDYLKTIIPSFVASSYDELKSNLDGIIRNKIIWPAGEKWFSNVIYNHSLQKNHVLFQDIFNEAIEKKVRK